MRLLYWLGAVGQVGGFFRRFGAVGAENAELSLEEPEIRPDRFSIFCPKDHSGMPFSGHNPLHALPFPAHPRLFHALIEDHFTPRLRHSAADRMKNLDGVRQE